MKISILSPDLSGNCLARSLLLAKALKRHYEVEIIGPMFGNSIWYPVSDDRSIEIKPIRFNGYFKTYFRLKESMQEITGDIIYANKPLMTSYGLGLVKKLISKKPLILDIDDWEKGSCLDSYITLSVIGRIRNLISSLQYFYSYFNIAFFEKLVPLVDEITVSNSFLQNKFGGTLIVHGRDTDLLNPERYNRDILRESFGLKGRRIISYIGTPRLHKGIYDLIEAVSMLRSKDILLLIVGITDQDRRLQSLAKEKIGTDRVMFFMQQPATKIGEFIAVSDVIVVPQKDIWATKGQFPAKIFDAMSMAKPIISTAVNDIPQILDGCGVVVKPGDIKAIADKINFILENEDVAQRLGKMARERCIEKYSLKAIEKGLLSVFNKYF